MGRVGGWRGGGGVGGVGMGVDGVSARSSARLFADPPITSSMDPVREIGDGWGAGDCMEVGRQFAEFGVRLTGHPPLVTK